MKQYVRTKEEREYVPNKNVGPTNPKYHILLSPAYSALTIA
jgi:hypothetical protein